ncbi:MAG TPA: Nudix family hydrolase [Casimicrobiaceae bacterium]|nr:Nudix family hydrolase [Casimicrobiaceae bacterium]
MTEIVRVAAAVIERGDGRVLLAQRPAGKAYAGYWEFPGGKLEVGETVRAALVRELHEELGIAVREASPWLVHEFVYPHAHVELNFWRVRAWDGKFVGHDGQAFAWQDPAAIDVAPLLPANARVIAALRLPPICAITCAEDLGEDTFLDRARRAFDSGVRLVQVRDKTWPLARRCALAAEVVALARSHGVTVLWNGTEDEARQLGCAGVHWTSQVLASATARPRDLVVGASCHTADDVSRASSLDVDFAVLAPVHPTPTHPAAVPLGWEGFARAAQGTRVPIYALGGLTRDDLDVAIAHGAHAIAMRRHAWPAA